MSSCIDSISAKSVQVFISFAQSNKTGFVCTQ